MNNVQHFPEQQTFILFQNAEEAGRLKYEVSDGLWNITHTLVNPTFRGQGLARVLVHAAIAESEKHSISLKADCSYAAGVLAEYRA